MTSEGHQIASHSWSHQNLTSLDPVMAWAASGACSNCSAPARGARATKPQAVCPALKRAPEGLPLRTALHLGRQHASALTRRARPAMVGRTKAEQSHHSRCYPLLIHCLFLMPLLDTLCGGGLTVLAAQMFFHCCLGLWTLQKPRWARGLLPFWSCSRNMINGISAGTARLGVCEQGTIPPQKPSSFSQLLSMYREAGERGFLIDGLE